MFLSTLRKETSSPDPDDTASPVSWRSSSSSHRSTPSGKRKNSSSGGSQGVKRRRVECTEGEQDGELERKYVELYCLSTGGYGTVFTGYRREDLLPVAIKHIPSENVVHTTEDLPLEVALMQMAGGDQSASGGTPVELLDWFELQDEVVLVMERPLPCSDLFDYIMDRGCLQEEEAKVLLRQLVEGVIGIHSRGVLHRDIKPENILIQTDPEGPRVRLLDFGCGCVLREGPYTEFSGTTQYIPPEWFTRRSYQAEPSAVWQIGVVLYDMVCGESPFNTRTEIITQRLRIPAHLSLQCKNLLRRCLSRRPLRRPSLCDLLQDPWLSPHHDTDT
ncbi:serine/threonine-protein kinase pim-2-like [Salminus brasiliensis]|uniref:serine/threonine-protein kinase pim-2-like n=1 Tax=Salminus brasiliensis TaxID=930266 RepID=UPI003B83594B